MATGWIKMRAGLMQHPKLIALSGILHDSEDFRNWLTPGGGRNGQIVSDGALRCVTVALLLKVWSASREHGKFHGDDLFLPHISVADLDQIAGCPGVGAAMESVGWAEARDQNGVFLPNFKQFNAPLTPAEKQSAYRARQAKPLPSVTEALPVKGNNAVTRIEENREELIISPSAGARARGPKPSSQSAGPQLYALEAAAVEFTGSPANLSPMMMTELRRFGPSPEIARQAFAEAKAEGLGWGAAIQRMKILQAGLGIEQQRKKRQTSAATPNRAGRVEAPAGKYAKYSTKGKIGNAQPNSTGDDARAEIGQSF